MAVLEAFARAARTWRVPLGQDFSLSSNLLGNLRRRKGASASHPLGSEIDSKMDNPSVPKTRP